MADLTAALKEALAPLLGRLDTIDTRLARLEAARANEDVRRLNMSATGSRRLSSRRN
jgi:hypothetical protein